MADAPIPRTHAEAKRLGVTRYFTGKACKYGHVAERAANGHCIECNRIADRVRLSKRDKLRRLKHPMRSAKVAKAWREKNPDKIAAIVAARKASGYAIDWYWKNPERQREVRATWRKNNREKAIAREQRRRARKRDAEGTHTGDDIIAIRKAQRDRCAGCGKKLKGAGEVDHIQALINGGSNWPANLQLLCCPCNRSKNDRDPLIFMRERGKLL